MRDEGAIVPGAQPGRKGSGCFKLSAEEKARLGDAAKSAAKKLKVKCCVTKVSLCSCAGYFQSSEEGRW